MKVMSDEKGCDLLLFARIEVNVILLFSTVIVQ